MHCFEKESNNFAASTKTTVLVVWVCWFWGSIVELEQELDRTRTPTLTPTRSRTRTGTLIRSRTRTQTGRIRKIPEWQSYRAADWQSGRMQSSRVAEWQCGRVASGRMCGRMQSGRVAMWQSGQKNRHKITRHSRRSSPCMYSINLRKNSISIPPAPSVESLRARKNSLGHFTMPTKVLEHQKMPLDRKVWELLVYRHKIKTWWNCPERPFRLAYWMRCRNGVPALV